MERIDVKISKITFHEIPIQEGKSLIFVNKIMLLAPKSKQSPYKKQLKQIARMAQYEPIASIPQPSDDFNYTIKHDRYSNYYENPKVTKKIKLSLDKHEYKLATILQTKGGSSLFPKIKSNRYREEEQLPIKKRNNAQSLVDRQKFRSDGSREKSLTIDTRVDSEQSKIALNMIDLMDNLKFRHLSAKSVEKDKPQNSQASFIQENKPLFSQRNIQESNLKFNHSSFNDSHLQSKLIQEQSSQDDQYEKDAIPGPGSYTYRYSDFDKKRTCSTNISFLSKSSRFIQKQQLNKTVVKHENSILEQQKKQRLIYRDRIFNQRFRKKIIPFNSLSPRKIQLQHVGKSLPGPQDYYPRQGIQQDLIKKIQKNLKGVFQAVSPRFRQKLQPISLIGPGSYDIQKIPEQVQHEDYFFKSKQPRLK